MFGGGFEEGGMGLGEKGGREGVWLRSGRLMRRQGVELGTMVLLFPLR